MDKRLAIIKRSCKLVRYLFVTLFIMCMTKQTCTEKRDQGISIVCWNTRGLVASLPYLNKLMVKNDIIAISEHWLHSNKLRTLNNISNDFNVIARSSKYADASEYGYKRGQGGVALFWRKTLGGVSPITTIKHDRFCGMRLQCDDGRVLNILSVYMPSPGSPDDYNEVMDELADVINGMDEGSLTIVCVDFNGDVGHLGGPRSTRRPTHFGKKVNNFFNEFPYVHVISLGQPKDHLIPS